MEEFAEALSGKISIECNYRMAFVGTVTLTDADGEALYTIRYGRMPEGDAKALCEGMLADVCALLLQRPELLVQLLADGAAEMWKLLEGAINETALAKPVSSKSIMARVISVIENPRPFVRTKAYFGPCRRRRHTDYRGPERRTEESNSKSPKKSADAA